MKRWSGPCCGFFSLPVEPLDAIWIPLYLTRVRCGGGALAGRSDPPRVRAPWSFSRLRGDNQGRRPHPLVKDTSIYTTHPVGSSSTGDCIQNGEHLLHHWKGRGDFFREHPDHFVCLSPQGIPQEHLGSAHPRQVGSRIANDGIAKECPNFSGDKSATPARHLDRPPWHPFLSTCSTPAEEAAVLSATRLSLHVSSSPGPRNATPSLEHLSPADPCGGSNIARLGCSRPNLATSACPFGERAVQLLWKHVFPPFLARPPFDGRLMRRNIRIIGRPVAYPGDYLAARAPACRAAIRNRRNRTRPICPRKFLGHPSFSPRPRAHFSRTRSCRCRIPLFFPLIPR